MCGRYASFLPAEALRQIFGTVNPLPNIEPTWNMAPTRDAPVVRLHRETRHRHLDLLRWGLVPYWVQDPAKARQPINARAEALESSSMFRGALARRRCLVPADAFYEWEKVEGSKARLPWAVAREDGTPMALGGLWEGWRGSSGEVLRTFVIITVPATEALYPLHDRMPVIIEPADWPLWLGELDGDARALLHPSQAPLRVWRVAPAVNNVRNDGEALLRPA